MFNPRNSIIGFHRIPDRPGLGQPQMWWENGEKIVGFRFVFTKTYGKLPRIFMAVHGCSQEILPFFVGGKCYPEMVGLGSTRSTTLSQF